MPGFFHRWLRTMLRAPCALCGRHGAADEACPSCRNDLTRTPWGVYAMPMGGQAFPVLWRELYGGPLTAAIHRSKYAGDWGGARFLGRCLGELPRPWLGAAPLIVPIPLSAGRLGDRGFNQSLMIARQAARAWGAEVRARGLIKPRNTMRQASLGREDRLVNLQDKFIAMPCCRERRVLLIDDIMTSGATLREAARAVLRAGGDVIGAAVIARVQNRTGRPLPTRRIQPDVQCRPGPS
jgi:predicted amidophosphoribosyltransferase